MMARICTVLVERIRLEFRGQCTDLEFWGQFTYLEISKLSPELEGVIHRLGARSIR